MKSYKLNLLYLALLLCSLNVASVLAQDANKIWTSVASTGTVDESDQGEIAFTGPFATFSAAAAPSARAIIRYNVTAVDGLFVAPGPLWWPNLIVNYRDNGPDARVQVYLREYDFLTASVTPFKQIVFDSDQYAADNDYQTRTVGNCGNFGVFDFVPNNQTVHAYFIEVHFYRANTGGNPGLGGLAVSRYGVCLGQ